MKLPSVSPVKVIIFFVLVIFLIFLYFLSTKENAFSVLNEAKVHETVRLGIVNHPEADFMVDVANTEAKREKGLSGIPKLTNDGMLFVFDGSDTYEFWMKGMNFALDFVWIRNDRVVGITENVAPPTPDDNIFTLKRYRPPQPVNYVLELPAGAAQRFGIKVGDYVKIKKETAK